MNMEKDVQFLEMVVKALVDYPNDVKINRTVDEMGVLISLDVNPADMGKIIGRSGNTAKATILAVGPDVTDVKVDDVILLDWAKASPVKIGDVQRAMIKEEFIIAVFEK